jgi:hypothetical protein
MEAGEAKLSESTLPLTTVALVTPSCTATSRFVTSPSQAGTIRHRKASACALLGRRAKRCRVSRSSSVSTTSTDGLPLRAITTSIVADNERNALTAAEIPI